MRRKGKAGVGGGFACIVPCAPVLAAEEENMEMSN